MKTRKRTTCQEALLGAGGRMIQVSTCPGMRARQHSILMSQAWGIGVRTLSLETTTACSWGAANFALMNDASDTFT
jgi:hypothetical protein